MKTKKFIGILLVLALCTSLLVGCELINNVSNLFGGGEGNNEALAQAFDELTLQCATAKRGVTVSLPATYTVGDVTFNIRWEGKSGVKVAHVGDKWIVSPDGKISTEKSVTVDGYILDDEGNNLHNDKEDYYYHFVQRITLVPESQIGEATGSLSVKFAGAIPAGWTYITNNEKYPNAEYYTAGAVKLKFEGCGVQSASFEAVASKLSVRVTISALNANEKSSASTHVFEVSAFSASGSKVGSAYIDNVTSAGDYTVTFDAVGATYVKVVMVGYPKIDSVCQNVALGGVSIDVTGKENFAEQTSGGNSGTGTGKITAQTEHAGTQADPYTVADALAAAKSLSADTFSENKVYVVGYVNSLTYDSGFGSYSGKMSDSATETGTFELYSAQLGGGATEIKNGAKVTVYGYLKNHQGKYYEIAYCKSKNDSPIVTIITQGSGETVTGGGSDDGGGTTGGEYNPLSVKIDHVIPEGWAYVPDSEQYPTPSYYSNGALKLKFVNCGVQSAKFEAVSEKLSVKVTVSALNANEKSSPASHVFEVSAFNASGSNVGTAYIDNVTSAGDYTVTFDAVGATYIKVMMVGYPKVDGVCQNVSFGGVSIDVTGTETFAPQTVSGTGSGTGTGTGTGTTPSGDLTATINKSVPSGWQYVVTDDGKSTDAEFYSSGALKMRFVNTGLVSPSFEAFSGQMEVKIVVNALNSNQKSSVADHNFVVEAFDASGNVVGTGYIDLTKTGTYSTTIDVTNAVSVRIVMISHPCVSGTCYNVALSGVSITFAK